MVKNGSNSVGNPKFKCKDCGFIGVIKTLRKSDEVKEQLIKASQERVSSRGLGPMQSDWQYFQHYFNWRKLLSGADPVGNGGVSSPIFSDK